MNRLLCRYTALLAVLCAAITACAQCPPAFLPGSTRPDFASGSAVAMVVWDPDGEGPLPDYLVVGGTFTEIGTAVAQNLAMWDGQTWREVGGGVNGKVNALHVHNGELVVGGSFTRAGTVNARNIARFNGTVWNRLRNGTGGEVLSLTTHDGQLIVGGWFTSVDTATFARFVASWDGSFWSPLDEGFTSAATGLASFNGRLYAIGRFPWGLLVWDGSVWSPAGSFSAMEAYSIGVVGNRLIVTGRFVYGSPISAFDGTSWTSLNGPGAHPNTMFATIEYQGNIVGGGSFWPSTETQPTIRVFDGTEWKPLGPNMHNQIHSMIIYKGKLIAAAGFGLGRSTRGSSEQTFTMRHPISMFDGTSWTPLAATGTNNTVNCFAKHEGRLIAGGYFTTIETTRANSIASFDGTSWSAFSSGMDDGVEAITVHNNQIIAGGRFTKAGGQAALRVAQWDGTSWSPLGAGLPGTVSDLASFDNRLFALVELSQSMRAVFQWNGASWQSVLSANLVATSSWPQDAFVIAHGRFFFALGSLYEYTNGTWVNHGFPSGQIVAATPGEILLTVATYGGLYDWNGSNFIPLTPPRTQGLGSEINALAYIQGNLYVVGNSIESASGRADMVRLSLGTLQPVASVLYPQFTPAIASITEYRGEVFIGGLFSSANGINSAGFARLSLNGVPWIASQPMGTINQCQGNAVSVGIIPASGYSGLGYRWTRNGVLLQDIPGRIEGTITPRLTLPRAFRADSGTYSCTIQNSCGETTSLEAVVSICFSDFDCSGEITMSDLTMFLNSWFSGDIRASAEGHPPTVDDLFQFIGDWFSNCLPVP